jgi:hypothetical protein
MQTEEATWRQAIEDEEAASGAVVAAERNLQQLAQHHLASSPTVDAAVTELDLQRSQYARTPRATDEATALYHRTEWDVMVADLGSRRADHEQRVQAVTQRIERTHLGLRDQIAQLRLRVCIRTGAYTGKYIFWYN